jgi:LCP family protein required for cell wall assembly
MKGKFFKTISTFLEIMLLLAIILTGSALIYGELRLTARTNIVYLAPANKARPATPATPTTTVTTAPTITLAPVAEEDPYYKYSDPGNNYVNILLLGTDARSVKEAGRSDTIILVGIDLKAGKIKLMSFPRDLRVTVPGHAAYGYVKLNSTYNSAYFSDGGPALIIATLESLVQGLKIGGYVKTNFGGFAKFIDAIGGVDYNVEERMYYKASDTYINLKAGQQHLNGEQATDYMRFRHDAVGDFAFRNETRTVTAADGTKTTVTTTEELGRAARQKKFIAAIIEQTKNIRDIRKLPAIMKAVKAAYVSNFGDLYLFSLAVKLRKVGAEDVTNIPFPASKVGSLWENGMSVSYVFPPVTQKICQVKILAYFPN